MNVQYNREIEVNCITNNTLSLPMQFCTLDSGEALGFGILESVTSVELE